ncbi:MAG: membrane protein insertase YidC [Lentisphaerae bacterium]|nr:membrane protein insertase YidC [Lentisphaerota bacterium]
MNKQEISIVVLLFALLVGWGIFNRHSLGQRPPPRAGVTAAQQTNAPTATLPGAQGDMPEALVEAPDAPPSEPVAPLAAARLMVLSNTLMQVVISSHGAVVVEAELPAFRASLSRDSGPMRFDFDGTPALALDGVPGLGTLSDFNLERDAAGTTVTARGQSASGITLERRFELKESYRLEITDVFSNPGTNEQVLPAHTLSVAPMQTNAGETVVQGMVFLGLDTLAAQGGSRVEHWGKKLNEVFGVKGGGFGCARQSMLNVPMAASRLIGGETDWVAAKNKYFVQILAPETPAADCRLHVSRDPVESGLKVSSVSAELLFAPQTLAAGASATRKAQYYLGPKQYDILAKLGKYQGDVMQFGWWDWFRWICVLLLHTLNLIHGVIPNYGVAVILVTVIVRTLFWPITHKSTQSMKKMQRIQPLVAQVREKLKDNPQKMNQEIMALYREHKVNPMSGCLPMVVQIPVFIALFVVLRSAIELRFAEFLWIKDLSEPEHLLAGVLPIPLNILPLLMTATTVIQQKLTPSTGDPQQQKIMTFMPIMFLFLFYNMASALVLYWTVSQGLAILQLVWSTKRGPQEPPLPIPAKYQTKKKK